MEGYPLGKTCEQMKSFQEAKHCRFCDEELTGKNTVKSDAKRPALNDVCTQQECLEKREMSCEKTLACGHACAGVRSERKCIECIRCEEGQQGADDYCNICWTEPLQAGPLVKLDCGHLFHFACAKRKVESKWSGARITFGFLECPLCKVRMEAELLKPSLKPMLAIYEQVKDLAVKRLKYTGDEHSPEITQDGNRFYKKPVEFALYFYSYFECFKCKKPYYGGQRACEVEREVDPKELICGGSSSFFIDLSHYKHFLKRMQ